MYVDLPGRIKRCKEIWNSEPAERQVACRMFLVIPSSCFCPASFSVADPRISDLKSAKLETYRATRAGNHKREYDTYPKKITLENGEVLLYFLFIYFDKIHFWLLYFPYILKPDYSDTIFFSICSDVLH